MYAPWGVVHFEAAGLMQTYGLHFAMRASGTLTAWGIALRAGDYRGGQSGRNMTQHLRELNDNIISAKIFRLIMFAI